MDNYILFRGKDSFGSDIKMMENSNPRKCSVECEKVLICTGFEYQYTTRRCWIKKTVSTSGPNFKLLANAGLYVKNIKVDIDGYKRYQMKGYTQFDIQSFKNYNRVACGKECDKNLKCLAFEFNFHSRDCLIKSQGRASGQNFKNHQQSDFYIKQYHGIISFCFKQIYLCF